MQRDVIYFISYQVATFILGAVFMFVMLFLCLKDGSIFSLFTSMQGIMLLLAGGVLGWLFLGEWKIVIGKMNP